jgi:hypothetical protein
VTIYFYYNPRDWLIIPADAVIILGLCLLLLSRLLFWTWLSWMCAGVLLTIAAVTDWAAAESGSVASIAWAVAPAVLGSAAIAFYWLRRRGRHAGRPPRI